MSALSPDTVLKMPENGNVLGLSSWGDAYTLGSFPLILAVLNGDYSTPDYNPYPGLLV